MKYYDTHVPKGTEKVRNPQSREGFSVIDDLINNQGVSTNNRNPWDLRSLSKMN